MCVRFIKYYDEHINDDKMGGVCSAHRRVDRLVQNFGQETLKGRNHLGDLDIDGRTILG
jgi:hypothetical protein